MGCVQSYFKRAHNSGISPSSTQESNSKQAGSEEGQPLKEDKSFAEEPESNDTSYGVEATAVRTLAASTGTVAILGTTAKTGDKGDVSPSAVDTILEEQEENGERTLETAEIHTEESSKNLPSRPNSNILEKDNKEESIEQVTSPKSTTESIKEVPPSESPVVNKSSPNDDASSATEEPKSPGKETESNIEESSSEQIVSELAKDKEEDLSKSISSERLKTNSISNTTLSSDSIVELDNGSVKQSPSADKVLESFDSSSTVEFVDAPKDIAKSLVQDDRTNPAVSISSELSNKANLPLDGEKTPEVTKSSPTEPDIKVDVNDLPPPPPQEVLEESLELPKSNDEKSLQEEVTKESSEGDQDVNTNSSSKDLANDEVSLTSEISSNISSSIQSVVKNEPNNQENDSKSAVENSSPNLSECNKAGTDSPLSSDNNSSFNDNGDNGTSPVTAVILSPAPVCSEPKKEEVLVNKSESVPSEKEEPTVELTNGVSSTIDSPTDGNSAKETIKEDVVPKEIKSEIVNDSENVKEETIAQVNGETTEDSPIDLEDEKVIAAATAIQASFRGYQTRQNLKSGATNEVIDQSPVIEGAQEESKKSYEEIKQASIDLVNDITEQAISILDNADDKMVAAATTIQANFRGFQTRQNLKNKLDSGVPTSEETIPPSDRSPALTPELIEAVKEEVDDICKEAEIIAAERAESADMLKGVQQVVVGVKDATLPSVSSVAAVRGSATPPSVSLDIDDSKEEVFDSLTDVDEKVASAATTIQATFRGFQTRKNLQNKDTTDAMPDYPPPAAEDEYLQSLEDLPPPDFEALESSYSEDVPTEPLAPPPDSLVFNEEDEDALASLQKPQECDELPEHRPATASATQDTDSSESSLSSAATKIQAGVRGYLTRKQMQDKGPTNTGGTTSTSTITSTVLDSDQSLSVSRDDEVQGVRSAISMDEESEVTRHIASPEVDTIQELVESEVMPRVAHNKRMSLSEAPVTRQKAPLRSAMSVQVVSDDEVWNVLKEDMTDAATTIQSNFRGYRARKQLQREDAMQVTTSGSSQATPSSGSVDAGTGRGSAASNKDMTTRSSGEFHDIIALSPPTVGGGGGEASAQTKADEPADAQSDEMVKRRAEDDDKEAAAAATKIQATFRGFKARQEMNQVDRAAAKIQAGFRGYKVRKDMKNSKRRASNPEKSVSAAATGNTEENAATKIQAGVRGFLVRRRNQKEQQAATKIQAGFRGFHSRNQTPTDQ